MPHRWREQYTKGWGVESHNRGSLGKELDPQERQGTSVGEGRRGEEGPAAIEYSLHPSEHACPPANREQCYPVHTPSPTLVPDLRLPAILEGWPHHLQEVNHLRGFPHPGLPTLWRGYILTEQHPAPPAPWKSSAAQKRQRKLCQATGSLPPSCWAVLPVPAAQSAPLSPSGPASRSHLQEVLHSRGAVAQHHQPPGRALWPRSTRARPAGQQEVCLHRGAPASSGCPGEVLLCLPAACLATPALGRCCTPMEQLPITACPLEELHSPEMPEQALPSTGRLPPSWCGPASPTFPQEVLLCFTVTLLAPPPPSGNALLPQRRPANTASPWETLHSNARANTARPRRVHLHQEKENNKQDEEAQKPFPVKPTGELT